MVTAPETTGRLINNTHRQTDQQLSCSKQAKGKTSNRCFNYIQRYLHPGTIHLVIPYHVTDAPALSLSLWPKFLRTHWRCPTCPYSSIHREILNKLKNWSAHNEKLRQLSYMRPFGRTALSCLQEKRQAVRRMRRQYCKTAVLDANKLTDPKRRDYMHVSGANITPTGRYITHIRSHTHTSVYLFICTLWRYRILC